MTNSNLLKKIIEDSGLKIGFIAEKMGISRSCLYNKINNVTAFNQFEIADICKILNIQDVNVRERIFFATKVD